MKLFIGEKNPRERSKLPTEFWKAAPYQVDSKLQHRIERIRPLLGPQCHYPVLVIPCEDFEKVSMQLKPLCRFTILEDDRITPLRKILRLQLRLLHEDLHSKTLADLFSHYSFETCTVDLQEESKDLLKIAKSFYANLTQTKIPWSNAFTTFFKSFSPTFPLATEDILPNGELHPIEKNLLTAILQSYPGFCLGEMHLMLSPKMFLLDNMHLLKNLGVTTLYLEPLLLFSAEELQEVSDCLPAIIEQRTLSHDRGQYMPDSLGYRAVLSAAKKAGIRLVPIDSQRAYYANKKQRAIDERVLTMNIEAYDVISQHTPAMGKYIVWVGDAHASSPFIDDKGSKCDGGIAQSFGIPIIYCKDENNEGATSHLSFSEVGPFKTPKIHIHRSLFPSKDRMRDEEQAVIAMLKDNDACQDRRSLEKALISLYSLENPSELLIHNVKKKLSAASQKHPWQIPSHQPRPDIIDFFLADNFLKELGNSAEMVTFDSSHLKGLLTGGCCTALCMHFLAHFDCLTKVDPSLSAKEKIKKSLEYIADGSEVGAIQAAMNTICCPKEVQRAGALKLQALISPYNLSIDTASDTITIGSTGWQELLQKALDDAKHSPLIFLRALLPKDNEKQEEHGHSTVLIKEGSHWIFYDPNYGVKFIRFDKLFDGLKNTLLEQHIAFNIPQLTVYGLSEKKKGSTLIPSSITFSRLQRQPLALTKLHALPETILHITLLEKEGMQRLIQAEIPQDELTRQEPWLLLLITTKWRNFLELIKAGYDASWLMRQNRKDLIKLLSISKELLEADHKKANLLLSIESLATSLQSFPALAASLAKDKNILALCGSNTPLLQPALEYTQNESQATPITTLALAATIQQGLKNDDWNLAEQLNGGSLQAAAERLGDDSLTAILAIEKQGLSPSSLCSMDITLAKALVNLAKKACKETYLTFRLKSVIQSLKYQDFEEIFIKLNDEELLNDLAFLLQKKLTIPNLSKLPIEILKALVRDEISVDATTTPKLLDILKESKEDLISLLRKTECNHLYSILSLCPGVFSIKLLTELPKHLVKSVLLAEKAIMKADPLLIERLIKEKIVEDWVEKHGSFVVNNLILLHEAGLGIDEVKALSYTQSQYFPIVLKQAPAISHSIKELGLNLQTFLQQSSLESFSIQNTFLDGYVYLQDKHPLHIHNRFTISIKMSVILDLHIAGLSFDRLLRCSNNLLQKILKHGKAIADLLQDANKKSIKPDFGNILTFLAVWENKKPCVADCIHHILDLYLQGFNLTQLSTFSDELLICMAKAAERLRTTPSKEVVSAIEDPLFFPLFTKAADTAQHVSYEGKAAHLAEIFLGLIKHHQMGTPFKSLQTIAEQNPKIRLRDLFCCSIYVPNEYINTINWTHFFSSKDVQQLIDKTAPREIKPIIELFLAGCDLSVFSSLYPETLKHAFLCYEELTTLQKSYGPTWYPILRNDSLALLLEKSPQRSLAKIIKLCLSSFSINQLLSNPCLADLISNADAILSLKDVKVPVLTASDPCQKSTPSLQAIASKTAINTKNSIDPVNAADLLSKVLQSKNPSYLLKIATLFPDIASQVCKAPELFHQFTQYECLELLHIDFQLFEKLYTLDNNYFLQSKVMSEAFAICQQTLYALHKQIAGAGDTSTFKIRALSYYIPILADQTSTNEETLLSLILGLQKTNNPSLTPFINASDKIKKHFQSYHQLLLSNLPSELIQKLFEKMPTMDPYSHDLLLFLLPYLIEYPSKFQIFELANFPLLFHSCLNLIHKKYSTDNESLPASATISTYIDLLSEKLGKKPQEIQEEIIAALINPERISVFNEVNMVVELIKKCELFSTHSTLADSTFAKDCALVEKLSYDNLVLLTKASQDCISTIERMSPHEKELFFSFAKYFLMNSETMAIFKLDGLTTLIENSLSLIHKKYSKDHESLPAGATISTYIDLLSEKLGKTPQEIKEEIIAALINPERISVFNEVNMVVDLIKKCEILASKSSLRILLNLQQEALHPDCSIDRLSTLASFLEDSIHRQLNPDKSLYLDFLFTDCSKMLPFLSKLDEETKKFWITSPYRMLFADRETVLTSELGSQGWLNKTLHKNLLNDLDKICASFFQQATSDLSSIIDPLERLITRLATGLQTSPYMVKNTILASLTKQKPSDKKDLISLISTTADTTKLSHNWDKSLQDALKRISCLVDAEEWICAQYPTNPSIKLKSSRLSLTFSSLGLSPFILHSSKSPAIQYAMKNGLAPIIALSSYQEASALDSLSKKQLQQLSETIEQDLDYFLEKAREQTVTCTAIIEAFLQLDDEDGYSLADLKAAIERASEQREFLKK